MKILLYGDPHWSTYSSILRTRGKKFSIRLENLIQSVNWIEQEASNQQCDMIVCLGDFFDKPTLTDEEITALKEINWSDLPHRFIVGNHESSINGLEFNSTKVLESKGFKVIDKVFSEQIDDNTCLDYIPYIIEEDRKKSLKDYQLYGKGNRIVFSHNDIKGFQFGGFLSQDGFDIKDIEANSVLYINGHLHNGDYLTPKILNVGNLTGQNFSEDAFKYKHGCYILDTDTLKLAFIENPYALGFYKVDIKEEKDLDKLLKIKSSLSVVSINCYEQLLEKTKELVSTMTNVVENRVIISRDIESLSEEDITILETVDHLEELKKWVHQKLGVSKIIDEELTEVCK